MEYQPNKLHTVLQIKEIYTIHYFKYARDFQGPGERHNFWELVYIDGGEAEILANEQRFVLKQGEAVLHRPNEYHNIFTHKKYANSAIVSFSCSAKALEQLQKNRFVLSEGEKELLNQIVSEGCEIFSDRLDDVYLLKMNKKPAVPFGSEQIVKNTLELLLISLIRGAKAETRFVEILPENALCADIVRLLKQNIYGTLTLDEIAAKMFFSKTYIKRIFSNETGEGIMQHFNRLKMEEAKRLLSENNFTITEIAYRLRFSSVHYFSRAFKKYERLSPSEYARSTKLEKLI